MIFIKSKTFFFTKSQFYVEILVFQCQNFGLKVKICEHFGFSRNVSVFRLQNLSKFGFIGPNLSKFWFFKIKIWVFGVSSQNFSDSNCSCDVESWTKKMRTEIVVDLSNVCMSIVSFFFCVCANVIQL